MYIQTAWYLNDLLLPHVQYALNSKFRRKEIHSSGWEEISDAVGLEITGVSINQTKVKCLHFSPPNSALFTNLCHGNVELHFAMPVNQRAWLYVFFAYKLKLKEIAYCPCSLFTSSSGTSCVCQVSTGEIFQLFLQGTCLCYSLQKYP